jgi:hypothetical protein
MDIFFQDPNEIPLPPQEIRIRHLQAQPFSDQRRVRIHLEITPFQKRPNIEIQILNEDGKEVASLSIIESIDPVINLTMHLPGEDTSGVYTASTAVYYYPEGEHQETGEQPSKEYQLQSLTEVQVVDRQQATFTIGNPPTIG